MNPVTILSLLLSLSTPTLSQPLHQVIPPFTSTQSTILPLSETRDPSQIQEPEISSFHVTSRIQYRYSRTLIRSQIRNPDTEAQLVEFAVVIPDSAFISNFSMLVNDEEFVSRVEEKEKAQEIFEEAVKLQRGSGLVK